jgi:mannosyltransferase
VRLRDWRLLAALTIAAALLRFATIDVQSYWFDEALTARLLRLPFGDMLSRLPDTELTPPLYYLLAWPWAHVVGSAEAALRALSALFGIAIVPVAYLAGREIVSRGAGLALAALVAFNPLLVWYSQEARPYSLLVLMCALSLLFCARAVRRREERSLWLWAGVSALALLTHYFAAFLVVPEGLLLAWAWRPRWRAFAAGAAVGTVGAALIPLAAHERAKIGTGYIEGVSLSRRAIGVPEDFLTGFVVKFDTWREKLLDGLALAIAGVGVWLAVFRTGAGERRGALLAGAAAVAAAGLPLVLALAGSDFLNTRNVIAACVPALLVVGAGFGTSRTAGVGGVAALCLVGAACVALVAADTTFHRENWRGIARALGRPPAGGRVVVVPPVSGEIGLGVQLAGLTRLPAGGASVSEVDVATPRSTQLGGERSGRPARPLPPGPGFRLVERRYAPDFTLLRWVVAAPVRVSVTGLAASARGVVAVPVALVERGGGGRAGP